MRIELVAAVNDEVALHDNLMASPLIQQGLAPLHIEKGFASASLAYLSGLQKCEADIIVFAHQDVYLPKGWENYLQQAISQLEKEHQLWAVLGVLGVDSQSRYHGKVWSSGLNRELIFPVDVSQEIESLDELLLVLNKKSGVTFDAGLPAFHLYGTDIVQTAKQQGYGAFVFHGPVVHNSNPVLNLDASYGQAYSYMAQKWQKCLPLTTCIVPVTSYGLPLHRFRFRRMLKNYFTKSPYRPLRNPTVIAKELNYEVA